MAGHSDSSTLQCCNIDTTMLCNICCSFRTAVHNAFPGVLLSNAAHAKQATGRDNIHVTILVQQR